jgi:hypothetical protein
MRRLIHLVVTPLFSVYISGCAVGGALFKSLFLRSGAPPREEFEAMEQREGIMLRELPSRTILVVPVGVLNVDATYQERAARKLAAALRDAGFPGAEAGTRVYDLPYPRQPNEMWTYWQRFRALADSVAGSPPGDTDYVLLMDVFGGLRDDGSLTGVDAVHVMVTTGKGDLVYGQLRNSMHREFQRIKPTSMTDACRLAVEDLLEARRRTLG